MAKGLTKKQEMFVAHYLVHLDGKKSAIAAGYSAKSAECQASQLLQNPKVAQQIAKKHGKRLEKLEITADRILEEIAKIAFNDPRKFFNADGSPKDITDLDDDSAACVAGFEAVELFDGSQGDQKHVTGLVKKLKLADKLKALELAGKHKKMWTDKVEHSGKVTLEGLVCGDEGADD
jgi:phage terminase small subunit